MIKKAGAAAAFTVDLLVYPLDTLKTRFQSPDYSRLYLDASTKAINRGAMFRGLYQGVGSVIIATLPSCKLNPVYVQLFQKQTNMIQQEHSSVSHTYSKFV